MNPIDQNKYPRRVFLKNSSLTTSLLLFQVPLWAKSLITSNNNSFPLHNVPVNKNLDPDWIKSLYKRDKPTTYSKTKNELKYIGMPAGGLHCGTVYLGGDGRLWLWEIYNDDRAGSDPKTVNWNNGISNVQVPNQDGANYVEPSIAENKRVLEQGFALRINHENKTIIKELKESDWDEVLFEATYPLATIHYIDKNLPVEVTVTAGALYIPLDAENSALPATVFSIDIKNTGNKKIEITIAGWLENGANKITATENNGTKLNEAIVKKEYTSVFSSFKASNKQAAAQRDAGTTCISFIGTDATVNTNAKPWPVDENFFTEKNETVSEGNYSEKLTGSILATGNIEAGSSKKFQYVLSWHFNHPLKKLDKLKEIQNNEGYYYGKQFNDAAAVAKYIATNFEKLYTQTVLWQQTYYDSSLPYWLLERSIINIGTLATANTYRFADGRFWGWEGVNACEGTCTHVWQYAQAMGRIFPSLEKDTRQRVDLGIAMQNDGGIFFRAEYTDRPAIDGQAGTILRIYREHQMSGDDSFLKSNWEKIKKATLFMMAQDKNNDGIIDTPMENTLDAMWDGEIAWIAGLCIAAAKAAQLMAEEMHDLNFEKICKAYTEKGSANMAAKLFNGEYFIHRAGETGRKKLGSYDTCHIDQVYGQSWAWQVGLGRLWDKEKTLSALRALWKYNFAPDVGPYRRTHVPGRPYALAGDAGLLMNTNPYNNKQPFGENETWQVGYFNECMTGFEHQVASHMMAEGMTDEALVITKAIHDRYSGAKRNPYNEIECSDHYARAMASYGTFITACGFEYHGPKGYIKFSPRWNKENFKAPFTAAEGWGTYTQNANGNLQQHVFDIKYGSLRLAKISVDKLLHQKVNNISATLSGKKFAVTYKEDEAIVSIEFKELIRIKEGEKLDIEIV
jgi:non-lysosomal glucosylceramidase